MLSTTNQQEQQLDAKNLGSALLTAVDQLDLLKPSHALIIQSTHQDSRTTLCFGDDGVDRSTLNTEWVWILRRVCHSEQTTDNNKHCLYTAPSPSIHSRQSMLECSEETCIQRMEDGMKREHSWIHAHHHIQQSWANQFIHSRWILRSYNNLILSTIAADLLLCCSLLSGNGIQKSHSSVPCRLWRTWRTWRSTLLNDTVRHHDGVTSFTMTFLLWRPVIHFRQTGCIGRKKVVQPGCSANRSYELARICLENGSTY